MKPGKTKERVRTVVFMAVITFISISAVSSIHLASKDAITFNTLLMDRRAVLIAAGLDYTDTPEGVASVFDECVVARPDEANASIYVITDPTTEEVKGYALRRQGVGLWGSISAMVGLTADRASLSGVCFTQHSETPGLGARISEPWFERQFQGKSGPFELVPEKTQSSDPTKMDAITGATITSSGVRDMLNETLQKASALVTAQLTQNTTD